MDFERMKRFVELVDTLINHADGLSIDEVKQLGLDLGNELKMMKLEVSEGNRPLYTLCVDDAQGFAENEHDGAVLTESELYMVKKGVESGLGDCWSEVMSTAVDEALSERGGPCTVTYWKGSEQEGDEVKFQSYRAAIDGVIVMMKPLLPEGFTVGGDDIQRDMSAIDKALRQYNRSVLFEDTQDEEKWCIKNRDGEFWLNDDGWVDRKSCTLFTQGEREAFTAPFGGEWVKHE